MRLIDADELITAFPCGESVRTESVRATIKHMPAIDIVRCKDCMLNTINTDGATEPWCYKFGYAVEDTDFCSYGERKEKQ